MLLHLLSRHNYALGKLSDDTASLRMQYNNDDIGTSQLVPLRSFIRPRREWRELDWVRRTNRQSWLTAPVVSSWLDRRPWLG